MITRRVLVAEDDPNDIFLLQRAFHRTGSLLPFNFVRDGQEAINYLSGVGTFRDREAYPMPVLLLLDLKMPRRTGLEVLKWLRHEPRVRRIPAIVYSSSAEPRDVNGAYELGASSYVVKPMDSEQWEERVRDIKHYWLKVNEPPVLGV